VAVVAVPFAVAAALLAANGLAWQRIGLIGAALYGVAALSIFYGIILALSVPVRLTVEGLCPRSAKTCPVGYDYPITNGENFAVYAALVAGAFAMLFVFFAVELRYRRRRRPPQLPQPPPP
jgi:O-antigen/teichoic acid export membrane protein